MQKAPANIQINSCNEKPTLLVLGSLLSLLGNRPCSIYEIGLQATMEQKKWHVQPIDLKKEHIAFSSTCTESMLN